MIISPSFLSCDFSKLKSEILSVSHAKWLHFDVMDGIFVKNKTYDYHQLKEIRAYSHQFFDCHLMIENPYEVIDQYIEAGADLITFHYESNPSLVLKTIEKMKSKGVKVGLSIKPQTSVSSITSFLPLVDLVLVMSVEPGAGGQKFLVSSLDKIKELDQLRTNNHYQYQIEVDGGINEETMKDVISSGADVLVMGSFIFNQENRNELIDRLENYENN